MVSANLVAAVATLLPAMAILWLYLGRYEGYFEQNRLFFALVVGLFAGIAVRFLEAALFPFQNPRLIQPGDLPLTTGTLVYSFAYTAFGLAFLESLGKTAVLGFKKFRARKDTAYYGTALGCGFGAMWVTHVVANGMVRDASGLEASFTRDALIIDLFVFVLGMGLLLGHVASAIWIGRGSGQGKLWLGAIHGTLWAAPGLAFYWMWSNGWPPGIAAFGCLAWGIIAMVVANRRVLETIVPPEMRDLVRKERRRRARREGRT